MHGGMVMDDREDRCQFPPLLLSSSTDRFPVPALTCPKCQCSLPPHHPQATCKGKVLQNISIIQKLKIKSESNQFSFFSKSLDRGKNV